MENLIIQTTINRTEESVPEVNGNYTVLLNNGAIDNDYFYTNGNSWAWHSYNKNDVIGWAYRADMVLIHAPQFCPVCSPRSLSFVINNLKIQCSGCGHIQNIQKHI